MYKYIRYRHNNDDISLPRRVYENKLKLRLNGRIVQ